MPRSIWKGAVSFGLVTIPVKVYGATETKDISFRQIHPADGGRIRYKRVCEVCGEEIPYAEIAKGYETEDGRMAILTDEDFADLPSAEGKSVEVVQFAEMDQVDPTYFEKTYVMEPDGTGTKPYVLLLRALSESGRAAVVRVALRSRESLALIRPAAPFLSGITVSGGEATRQAVFLRELFLAVRADPELSRLTCFVDTNGDVNAPIWDVVLAPVMDAAMVDLKCFDDDIHRRLTGVANTKVLATIANLAGRGKLYEVRLLMLPGHNDSDHLLARTGSWLASIDPRLRVKVIGFRRHGVRPTPVPLVEPTPDQLAHYRAVLAAEGDFDLVVV